MDDLFRAQSHVYNRIFNFIDSMCLKCAVQLGVPDVIHSHGKPITLPELVSALRIHPSKTDSLYRLMRVLVHSGIFAESKIDHNDDGSLSTCYALTPSSRVLAKDNITCLSPFVTAMLDPAMISPWHCLGDWFRDTDGKPNPNKPSSNAFEAAHGTDLWGFGKRNPEFNDTFNLAMANDSRMMNLVIKDCREVFEGLGSLVDVGGGTGTVAKIICEAFPGLKCTVLDLPHVVDGLLDTENLRFVGGDMFQEIPSGDAILFKLTLHFPSDEDCVKILKKCREAIGGRDGNKGKLIIIDIVIGDKDDHESAATKLYFDVLMMTVVTGRERTEKEWEQLFLDAGFSRYSIKPVFGLRSLIEVYP